MAQKWNTVKDKKGNTFVNYEGTLWPTIGGGGASLSYGSSVKSNSGGQSSGGSSGNNSSSSSTVNVASAPAVSAPAATESSGNDWYAEALRAQQRARQRAYDAAAAAQRQQYENGVRNVNSAAEKALQDAYVNKMQNQRTMNQGLTAQGMTGGASETALSRLLNSYDNSRASTENARLENLANLENTYLNNMASLRGILSNGQAGDISQYMSNIASLAAQNGVNPLTLYQQSGGDTSSAQSYYEWLQNYLASKGLNTTA
nr:MAG TPA: hypothetical protein [Ackermannviridae sp.]